MAVQRKVTVLVTWSAAVLTVAGLVLPPTFYFFLSYQHLAGAIEAEAEISARIINQIIGANPTLWRYEQVRIAEYLNRRPGTAGAELRRVFDLKDRVVAESIDPLPRPWISRSVALLDAGTPVGRLEVSRSLRPFLIYASFLALALIPLSVLAFHLLRIVPLRAIERSEEAQRRLEEQLRSSHTLRAVGQLARGLAHDFNNTLSAIKGYASAMRCELSEDDPHRQDLDEILSATDRAAAVTRSLLTFSRGPALKPERTDLVSVVRTTEQLLCRVVGGGIKIVSTFPSDPLWVLADSVQIEQILVALVTNARDAMPAGGRVELGVAVEVFDHDAAQRVGLEAAGEYARVSVADTGTGIEPQIRTRLFEPFLTTKAAGQRIGMSLAMSYGIIKQYRGAFRVFSQPGRGATVSFLLPLLTEPAPASPQSLSV